MGFLILIAIIFIGAPIGRAIAKRIAEGPSPGDAASLRREIEDLEHRLDASERRLEDALDRLGETEERLDFTERMLTRMNSREQLGPGGSEQLTADS